MLNSIDSLLEHVKEVQKDIIELSKESTLMLSKFIEENNLQLDDRASASIQYQDIISQQLNATVEAIESVQKSIHIFENASKSDELVATDSINKLHKKLNDTLEEAKRKRDAFAGRSANNEQDEIEFLGDVMATIMVLDDSKTVRNFHGSIIKSYGMEICEAENGMEALEKSLDTDIDLYLVDVNMPIMDGYSFVEELRKTDKNKLVPVIMITTQEKDEDKRSAYKVGVNLFETKPIKPEKLKAYLDILVGN